MPRKYKASKKNKKQLKKKLRRTKRGGMWRIKNGLPVASADNSSAMATPYYPSIHGYNIPSANNVNYITEAKTDNASYNQQLIELETDIVNNGFPNNVSELISILNNYPDFNINIKDKYNNTILDKAIEFTNSGLVDRILNNYDIDVNILLNKLINIESIIDETSKTDKKNLSLLLKLKLIKNSLDKKLGIKDSKVKIKLTADI